MIYNEKLKCKDCGISFNNKLLSHHKMCPINTCCGDLKEEK